MRIRIINMHSALNSAQHRESSLHMLSVIISHVIILISSKAEDVCLLGVHVEIKKKFFSV